MQPILAGAALVIDFAMEDVADNEEDDDVSHRLFLPCSLLSLPSLSPCLFHHIYTS